MKTNNNSLFAITSVVFFLSTGCKPIEEASECFADWNCGSDAKCVNGSCVSQERSEGTDSSTQTDPETDSNCDTIPDGGCKCVEGKTTTCGELYGSFCDCADRKLKCSESGEWPSETACEPDIGDNCEEDCDTWKGVRERLFVSEEECADKCHEAGWPEGDYKEDDIYKGYYVCECRGAKCNPAKPWSNEGDLKACPVGMICHPPDLKHYSEYYCTTRRWNSPCFVGHYAPPGECRAYCKPDDPDNECDCGWEGFDINLGACRCNCRCENATQECRIDGTCACLIGNEYQ